MGEGLFWSLAADQGADIVVGSDACEEEGTEAHLELNINAPFFSSRTTSLIPFSLSSPPHQSSRSSPESTSKPEKLTASQAPRESSLPTEPFDWETRSSSALRESEKINLEDSLLSIHRLGTSSTSSTTSSVEGSTLPTISPFYLLPPGRLELRRSRLLRLSRMRSWELVSSSPIPLMLTSSISSPL